MKVSVDIAAGGSVRRVSWYEGTSDVQVEKAIRLLLRLPSSAAFLLRDGDGDLVPASASLPPDQLYTLVPSGELENTGIVETRPVTTDAIASVLTSAETLKRAVDAEPVETGKRRKTETPDIVVGTPVKICEATRTVSTIKKVPGPSLATAIAQFVEAFTRPIENDDNVSFIPNVGRFSLDELYYDLVQDSRFHPKGRDIFYKMTSLYGVDRQRVVRYYRCQAEGDVGIEVVRSRPEGKGALLRRYREVVNALELEESMKAEPFVVTLELEPKDVVARYMHFVDSFTPISRTEYHSYCGRGDEAVQDL